MRRPFSFSVFTRGYAQVLNKWGLGKRCCQPSASNHSLSPSLDELVAADHPVRVVHEVLEKIDITALLHQYKPGGTSSYHPWMLVKAWYTPISITFSAVVGSRMRCNGKPANITADAGYGSEENYQWLENKRITAYVKHNYFDATRRPAYAIALLRRTSPMTPGKKYFTVPSVSP